MWYCELYLLCLTVGYVFGNHGKIIYGGLFDDEINDNEGSDAFKFAINLANTEPGLSDISFDGITEDVSDSGPFGAMSTTLSYIEEQAIAIFGPKNEESINVVQSVCDTEDKIHIITKWGYKPLTYTNTINFYPHAEALSLAYYSIVTAWQWKSFTVLYEDNNSLLRMVELIKRAKHSGIYVSVKQLDEAHDQQYRNTLKKVLKSGERNVVIDCSIDILEEVLLHAQQVGMMTSQYNYFIANLDMQTIHTEAFRYAETNITGIRIIDPNSDIVVQKTSLTSIEYSVPMATELKTDTALLIDAVTMLSKVIREQSSIGSLTLEDPKYNISKSLFSGTTLLNILKGQQFNGLSGLIQFDTQGYRTKFDLDIVGLHENGITKIGTWNSTKGLTTYPYSNDNEVNDPSSLRNKTFIVITCLTDPYGMLKESPTPLYGNDRYEGFGIDLIEKLAEMEGFNYSFIIREDKANGALNKSTGKWSGMIGDLMDMKADLAITDLTITSDREAAVDFSSPFMNLGISILAKKPGNAPPSFFSFADPFALDTWIMLAVAYFVVSLSLFVMGRLCPSEWTNPYPCIEEPDFLINQFSLRNSAWFSVGSLMQQGTEIAPIAISTRMVAGMWWFFVLIMVSSYTANLAAFLTTENPVNLFTDVYSLIENAEKFHIKMGAKDKGATALFFKNNKDDKTFQAVGKYMDDHPEDMVSENKDGVARAEKENYAFFMESTSIEYETQRHCELQQYGKLLDDKGYGIAMRKNSTYRKALSMAILKIQASGEIDKLKRKWWEERKGGGQCNAQKDSGAATPLDLKNVEGVFYVTILGAICSIFAVLLEMLLSTTKSSVKTKTSFKEALKNEFKAYLNFSSNVKPAIQDKSESNKSQSESPKGSESKIEPAPYGFALGTSKEPLTSDV